jgi:Zn-dependent peptidase ImmA (M78 family)
MGFLFLQNPPADALPIRDLRTLGDKPVQRPSPDLLETVQTMQSRQAWMREFLISEGESPLTFVGSAKVGVPAKEVAMDMRRKLGLSGDWARFVNTWTDALSYLREKIEAAGIIIVFNGVVGNSTRRTLKTSEFRGFALCDTYAPLIFINGTDGKAAQMFTVAHELAHIWVGQEGVSNLTKLYPTENDVEIYCNSVAAEFLVPASELVAAWADVRDNDHPYGDLARRFKVSPIVAARCAADAKLISRDEFFNFYEHYTAQERRSAEARASGGDFWNTQNVRVGYRFGSAVVRAAKEGKLLFRDAYRLTGLHGATFDKYAMNLGYRL